MLNEVWFYITWPLVCYVVGSVSNGDLIARAAGVNIREVGTGNPGTANIWREIGPRHGTAVFVLDLGKGLIATLPLFLAEVDGWVWIVSVMALMTGQIFPVFFRFKGNISNLFVSTAPLSGDIIAALHEEAFEGSDLGSISLTNTVRYCYLYQRTDTNADCFVDTANFQDNNFRLLLEQFEISSVVKKI